jgi:copper chaperone
MKSLNLTIEGMSCGHCLNAVNRALTQLNGVQIGSVQIGKASLNYDETKLSPDQIAAAVSAEGYRATVA